MQIKGTGSPPRSMTRLFSKFHIFVYRLSAGRLMGNVNGLPVLLLTTKGRKSGKKYTRPLVYLKDGEHYVIMPGVYERPDWLLNLMAHPETQIAVGKKQFNIIAKEMVGAERERIWQTVPAYWREYQAQYASVLPIMKLRPINA